MVSKIAQDSTKLTICKSKSQQKFPANLDGASETFGRKPVAGATSTERVDISSFGYSSTNENSSLGSLIKEGTFQLYDVAVLTDL